MATTNTIEQGRPVPIAEVERPDLISWGAVFAGTVAAVGISWLLLVLGSAVGIAISSNLSFESIQNGLGFGAWIWLVFTAIVAYFFGGWIAAWLAGEAVKSIGMLHGVAVWGTTIVWMLLLSYAGTSTLAQSGENLLGGSVKAGTSLVASTVAGTATGKAGNTLENSPIVAGIQFQLKNQINQAQGNAAGGATNAAPSNDALRQAAVELVQGNDSAAKIILAANTDLSGDQVNGIVNGVSAKAKDNIQRFNGEAASRVDAIKSYTEALLWVIFVGNSLGLILAIIGGWLGSHSVHHFYVLHRRRINT